MAHATSNLKTPRETSPRRADSPLCGSSVAAGASSSSCSAGGRGSESAKASRGDGGQKAPRESLLEAQPGQKVYSSLEEWKKRNGVAPEIKVFSVSGVFPGIRKALLQRGWVENEEKGSPFWDLKYALWQRDIGNLNDLRDDQVINYFARNSELTSKAGLVSNLYNFCTSDAEGVDSFFPRCYDLKNSVDLAQFSENFKLSKCVSLLRRFARTNGQAAFSPEAVSTALEVCQKRLKGVDETLDEDASPPISDEQWAVLEHLSLTKPGTRLKDLKLRTKPAEKAAAQEEIDPRAKSKVKASRSADVIEEASAPPCIVVNSNSSPEDEGADGAEDDGQGADEPEDEDDDQDDGEDGQGLQLNGKTDSAELVAAREVLAMHDALSPQSRIDGERNVWLLKPAGKSRGRGIELSSRLDKILDVAVGRGAEARWVVQKYLENSQIVNRKKFDIRQWVVVTQWQPLACWFYQDAYIRFAFADYDVTKLKNKYAHLTNNSIAKKADGFDDVADETMWHTDEYQEYLKGLNFERNGRRVDDPWAEVIQPQMKRIVLRSLEAVQDSVQPRTNAFELFGYDFMVSDDLNAWLIEINSSPDCSYSTSTTKGLVKAMLDDLVKVAVDAEKFGIQAARPKRKWDKIKVDTGRFQLLEPLRRRREEKFGKVKAGAQGLSLCGTKVALKKPPKNSSAMAFSIPVADERSICDDGKVASDGEDAESADSEDDA